MLNRNFQKRLTLLYFSKSPNSPFKNLELLNGLFGF